MKLSEEINDAIDAHYQAQERVYEAWGVCSGGPQAAMSDRVVVPAGSDDGVPIRVGPPHDFRPVYTAHNMGVLAVCRWCALVVELRQTYYPQPYQDPDALAAARMPTTD